MPELISISKEKLARLEERAKKLAMEKSYLQLVYDLIDKLGRMPGLENTVENLVKLILDSIGGSNVALYYVIDGTWRCVDVYGKKATLDALDDDVVRQAFTTRTFVEYYHDFGDTKMLTPEFTKASTWATPLMVGDEVFGVLKMEGMLMAAREARDQLRTFFNYAALVLKNEIQAYGTLKKAYDHLAQEVAERTRAEEELRKSKDELEARVRERTAELQRMNEQLQIELAERERAEEELRRFNRLYALLSQVNQSILRVRSRQELFQQVCDVAVKHGGFTLAWVGWDDPATHVVVPVAQTGDDLGYLKAVRIRANDSPEGRGPTGTCIREGRPYICNDFASDPRTTPWHEAAAVRGLRASASMPVRLGGKVCAAFMVYADTKDYFQKKEVDLLEEVAADVSFALDHLETEAQRQRVEDALRALTEDLDRRVRERTVQLEAANKELEAFSYSVSHDLQAPLRAIDGFSALLLNRYGEQLDAQGQHYLQRMRDGTTTMAQLIEALLGLSRLTRSELQRQEVDLSALAQAVASALRSTDPSRSVEFVIAPGVRVNGDAALLRVVLDNLLRNAWKFTSKHATARIEFGCTRQNGQPVYFVRDDGAGFDMAYVGKLFGAFQRLHSVEAFAGTGIGLATVQRIIRRHGGRVWAEGAVEQGATFYFTLPPELG